eukprot:131576-Chlamydomonas_euryale.AAC.1
MGEAGEVGRVGEVGRLGEVGDIGQVGEARESSVPSTAMQAIRPSGKLCGRGGRHGIQRRENNAAKGRQRTSAMPRPKGDNAHRPCQGQRETTHIGHAKLPCDFLHLRFTTSAVTDNNTARLASTWQSARITVSIKPDAPLLSNLPPQEMQQSAKHQAYQTPIQPSSRLTK